MKAKYLILDFGKVLAYPVTGDWFITPNFYKFVKRENLDIKKLHESMNKIGNLLGGVLKDEKEEYIIFKKFYKDSLISSGYIDNNIENIAESCAKDFVFNNDKYKLYDDVENELEKLSKKYILICLTDNWPSGQRYMKDMGIYNYFKKVYISSDYGYTKYDGLFFDHPIKDFNISKKEAIFVDDSIDLMSIAEQKGLIPILMDRDNEIKSSDYNKINLLKDIETILIK